MNLSNPNPTALTLLKFGATITLPSGFALRGVPERKLIITYWGTKNPQRELPLNAYGLEIAKQDFQDYQDVTEKYKDYVHPGQFYMNTISFVVLTDDGPLTGSEMTLADIEREYTEGGWSAGDIDIQSEHVDEQTMRHLLEHQGSSPDFFGLGGTTENTETASNEEE